MRRVSVLVGFFIPMLFLLSGIVFARDNIIEDRIYYQEKVINRAEDKGVISYRDIEALRCELDRIKGELERSAGYLSEREALRLNMELNDNLESFIRMKYQAARALESLPPRDR